MKINIRQWRSMEASERVEMIEQYSLFSRKKKTLEQRLYESSNAIKKQEELQVNVRELIESLLDYDMDAQVEIRIESKEDTDDVSNFDFEESRFTSSKYLILTVDLEDKIVVDEIDFNNLKNEKDELANAVENLQSKLEDAEQQIYELERESE